MDSNNTEIVDFYQASQAVMNYTAPEISGVKVRKVRWADRDELIAMLTGDLLRDLEALSSDAGSESGLNMDAVASLLRKAPEFANWLLERSLRMSREQIDKLCDGDLSWDAGLVLVGACLQVNLVNLKDVVGFFNGVLDGVRAALPSKPSEQPPESTPQDEGQ